MPKGPIVELSAGRVEGRTEDGLCVFRGIPYARPPVGPLRLHAPEPPEPWAGVRPAQQAPPSSPQNHGLVSKLLGSGDGPMAEDCLYLNVWTPALDAARRPVLVWIHGGGFTIGSGSDPVYSGASLARRGDVVVVTLNYRLGALSFFAGSRARSEGSGADAARFGNLGLRDQVAALGWVRDHIGAFGGDPDAVTLFGESAGAMSIGTLLAVPAARGLFRRAILQSGAADHVHDEGDAHRVAHAFLDELGLSSASVGRLADVPVDAILAAQQRTSLRLRDMRASLSFQPVVDGDFLPTAPRRAVADGSARGIGLLIGTNLDEWKLFGIGDAKLEDLDQAGLVRRCARNLGGGDEGLDLARRVVETYHTARAARGRRAEVSPRELWHAIESDRWFRRPATALAEAAAAGGDDVYAYLFDWESPALGGKLGSCHALEIPFVFGTHEHGNLPSFVGGGPAARLLSERMQDAWLAFAREGRPAPDWPGYEAESRRTQLLGPKPRVEDAPLEAERAFWDVLG